MSSVADSRRDTAKVISMPSSITPVSSRAEDKEALSPPDWDTKNMDIMAMRVGKRPLQGTKRLVMHMVSACFPQARQALKHLSRLNATRGRYPKSSRRVNRGKKIAMGGSITATTHATTRYTPSSSISYSHDGREVPRHISISLSCRPQRRLLRSCDG